VAAADMAAAERDPAATADRLRRWLIEVRGLPDARVDNVTIPAATGFSNETIMFDAQWSDGDVPVARELVVRIAPSSYQVFPDDTFLRQFHVMRALEQSGVPMAAMRWIELDASWFGQPFWIMDRIRGEIPSDTPPYAGQGWLADALPAQQQRAWASGIEAMARIHNTPLGKLDISSELLVAHDDPLGAEIEHYQRFLRWAEQGERHELAHQALAWLQTHRPKGAGAEPTLVWGDARLSNLIFRDFEVVAVLDWEMVSIGDPRLDLGWWIFADETLTIGAGLQRLPGFATRADTAALWAARTGRSAEDLDYFVVLAGLRFTVIMLRMGKLLAGLGLVPDSFPCDNIVSQGLVRALASAGAKAGP
jgi:aminoglycoside phosphotransferase (APT) family kinase protein